MDDTGNPVTWTGPKGSLNSKTRPVVEVASYGTSLIFNKVRKEDSGTYTCSDGKEFKNYNLVVKSKFKCIDTNFFIKFLQWIKIIRIKSPFV